MTAPSKPALEPTRRRKSRVSPASLAVLLFAVATAATGQIMLKHGMTQAAASSSAEGRSLVTAAGLNIWVLSGLVVFGISALAWLLTLSRLPLNVAYPFNALGYLGILAASALILHERVNVPTVVGSAMVVCGLIIVVTLGPAHPS
jgi:multidrug transporter EmrE-like cation transporter